ncbi:SRPBCC domain-containing protein [Sphingomonas lycopersici]|uniref:SRPBCC domain-containing protein n=1 Tax=Sphingomonas lycopersici TaxID=2951807 RepID=A0AA41ZAA4_9SPHN|nr:SRPBCC domain-containing protein [Sphingomonas lycopersici]MCW6536895.1 SRPBCC domain-containing protein [Sphingomonas lycopersici]
MTVPFGEAAFCALNCGLPLRTLARAATPVTVPQSMNSQSHSASRIIIATPRAIFCAIVDPEVLVKWRAPVGMEAVLLSFDPRLGGGYKMVLRYKDGTGQGKTTADSDVVLAHFEALEAEERIVEAITFENAGPAFGGTMRLTTTMKPVTGGTRVTLLAEEVPAGISEADHVAGMEAVLKNLANLLE